MNTKLATEEKLIIQTAAAIISDSNVSKEGFSKEELVAAKAASDLFSDKMKHYLTIGTALMDAQIVILRYILANKDEAKWVKQEVKRDMNLLISAIERLKGTIRDKKLIGEITPFTARLCDFIEFSIRDEQSTVRALAAMTATVNDEQFLKDLDNLIKSRENA